MITVGLVYIVLGLLVKIQFKDVTPAHKRIKMNLLMVGLSNVCYQFIAWSFPPLGGSESLFTAISVVIFCLIMLPELNRTYRLWRDHQD